MNKKILASVFIIGLLALAVGWGTYSYFNDTEESTGNVFQAGTIDLAVNGENPWTSAAFTFTDVKPCEELDPFSVTFRNVGQNPGVLTFSISYIENDKGVPDDYDMGADAFAALIYVKAVTYQYQSPDEGYVGAVHDDLANWLLMDGNQDGYVSLYELKLASPMHYDPEDDPLPVNAFITYTITFHLGDSLSPWEVGGNIVLNVLDNRPQADGVEVTVTAILEQVR